MTEDKTSIDDLFREEDIPFDIETEVVNEPQSGKSRKFGLVPIGGAVALLLSLWYLAHLNSDRFYLSVNNGMVSVEKGLYFPIGKMGFHPNVAYQSFELPKQLPELPQDSVTAQDRDHLLRDLLIQKAIEELQKTQAGSLERARDMFMLSYKLEYGQPTEAQQENFMGQYNMRKMYSNIGKIHGLLSMAKLNADRARSQGVQSATDWLQVIDKALKDLDVLAKRDNVDLSLFDSSKKLAPKSEESPAE